MSFFGHGSSHAENRATHDTPQGTFHHPDIPVPEFGGINVWTAASDGDLARVEIFIQSGQHRADEPDEQGYTREAESNRGGARRRRGYHVDSPRGRVAASLEGRRRGRRADSRDGS